MKIVYSPHYNIGFFGAERLHPFDSRKYGRAWKRMRRSMGPGLKKLHVRPDGPVKPKTLFTVHSADYIGRLHDSKYVAKALEVSLVGRLPWRVIDWCVLRPMRWATQGTIVAAREAMRHGLAVNLSGGYHHAKPNGGEGFCIYSDIALAVHALRDEGLLLRGDRVAYIDLDAHQGNGVCHAFRRDDRVFIFDMYNSTIYPSYDTEARTRIDCDVRLTGNCTEGEYFSELRGKLPGFLDSVGDSTPIGLAIYNAGTDVFEDDALGGLNVSSAGIVERDALVVDELRRRGIPTVMLLSGGYSSESYKHVADSVLNLIDKQSN